MMRKPPAQHPTLVETPSPAFVSLSVSITSSPIFVALVLANVLLFIGSVATAETVRSTRVFGVSSVAAGHSVVTFDAAGNEVGSIPIDGREIAFGRGDYVGLLSPVEDENDRTAQVYDARGILVGEFRIPRDRQLSVGRNSILVRPRTDHQVGSNFELEFRRVGGAVSASQMRPGRTLVSLDNYEGDHWLAYSIEGEATQIYNLFDSSGRALWEYRIEGETLSLAAVSPTGARAAIGYVEPEASRARLVLLDGNGQSIREQSVTEFQHVLFRADDRILVLIGKNAVQFMNAETGAVIAVAQGPIHPAVGSIAVFSTDGAQVHVLCRNRNGSGEGGKRLFARTYTNLETAPRETITYFDEVPGRPGLSIVDLNALPDGRLSLITNRGSWIVAPEPGD